MSISLDEFDLDDLDDTALIAALQAPPRVSVQEVVSDSIKRKRESIDTLQSKKLISQITSYPSTSPLAVRLLQKHFGLPGFRLKQEAVIARLLNGGSAVVVLVS